eukprot:Lithocolla_globosa_v1_NODE_6424_length_1090_cov_2.584541.p2 type:complete len:122 gc:universal NODE_6424_length_1090_cov_2.584541:810-445(-)
MKKSMSLKGLGERMAINLVFNCSATTYIMAGLLTKIKDGITPEKNAVMPSLLMMEEMTCNVPVFLFCSDLRMTESLVFTTQKGLHMTAVIAPAKELMIRFSVTVNGVFLDPSNRALIDSYQ